MLFLDSDSSPLIDPTAAFELEEYKRNGNAWWPDIWCTEMQIFNKLPGITNPWAGGKQLWQTESGQFVLNRCAPGGRAGTRVAACPSGLLVVGASRGRASHAPRARSLDSAKYLDMLEWFLFLNVHDSVVYRWAYGGRAHTRGWGGARPGGWLQALSGARLRAAQVTRTRSVWRSTWRARWTSMSWWVAWPTTSLLPPAVCGSTTTAQSFQRPLAAA